VNFRGRDNYRILKRGLNLMIEELSSE